MYTNPKITILIGKSGLVIWLIITLLIMPACSGRSGEGKESVTVDTEEIVSAEEEEEEMCPLYLNARGFDNIKIGMRIAEIPPQSTCLYDSIVLERGYDSKSYSFLFKGQRRFTVYEFESGVVDVISADDESVSVQTPDGEALTLGMPFSKVLALKGVNPVWQSADDGEGMWCWTWRGIWFQPDQQNLNDELAHTLYSPANNPTRSQFTDDIVIGYIGTGLPW